MNEIETKIDRGEEQLHEMKSKIVRSARDSQTNLPIHSELISSIRKQEIFKENELRKLRFSHFREQKRLEQVTHTLDSDPLDKSAAKELAGWKMIFTMTKLTEVMKQT